MSERVPIEQSRYWDVLCDLVKDGLDKGRVLFVENDGTKVTAGDISSSIEGDHVLARRFVDAADQAFILGMIEEQKDLAEQKDIVDLVAERADSKRLLTDARQALDVFRGTINALWDQVDSARMAAHTAVEAIQHTLDWHEWSLDPDYYKATHGGWTPMLPWRKLLAALAALKAVDK